MRQLGMFFLLAGFTVSLTGCGQIMGPSTASSRSGGMAVVDLDKVAAETGRDRVLAQSLELAQSSLNQSYAKTVEDAKDQLNKKLKGYGDSPTENEKKDYSQSERNALNQLTQIQNKARSDFEQYKQVQIAKFRAELKPITQEIATALGNLGNPDTVPDLIELLGDPDDRVKLYTITAIAKLSENIPPEILQLADRSDLPPADRARG